MDAMDVKEELDTRMATACPGQSVEAWIQECIKTNSFMDPSTNAMRDVLQHDMEMILLTYGGPPQFLEAALTDLEQKTKFATFLDHMHGDATNIWDGDGPTLVTKGTTPFLGKNSYLNFAASASVKPPTFHKVALQLVDEFALNGFQSASEPVQIWFPKESSPTGNCFHVSFVKGAARCHTLQALLLYFMYTGRRLSTCCPALFASITGGLTLVNPLTDPALETIAFKTAQLAQRGSIRKAVDVFSWVVILKKLAKDEKEADKVIGRWNAGFATKEGKLTGNKRSAILNLLTAPKEGVELLFECVARLGPDNAPVTEESLSNKKIYPGHVWRQFQLPNWTQLMRVTEESFNIMCKYIVSQHDEKPAAIRSKLSKAQVEDTSQLAAVTSALATKLEVEHAMPPNVIDALLMSPVSEANSERCLELQAHIHETS